MKTNLTFGDAGSEFDLEHDSVSGQISLTSLELAKVKTIDTKFISCETRLDTEETKLDALETEQTSQDSRISAVETGQSSSIVAYATQALLYADLDHDEGAVGLVTNDTTPANNGNYRKVGASGSGSWEQSSYDRVAIVEEEVRADPFIKESFETGTDTKYGSSINSTPAIVDSNNVEILGFEEDGSLIAKLSQSTLDKIPELFRPEFFEVGEILTEKQNTLLELDTVPSIVDSNNVEILGFGKDGSMNFKPSANVLQYIKNNLPSEITAKSYLVCWGDSLTYGIGGDTTSYPSVLATESGLTTYNCGIPGETSTDIAARSNANVFKVSVAGGVIPASGSVNVTFDSINGYGVSPKLWYGEYGGDFSGVLGADVEAMDGGIHGRITYSSPDFLFTRTTDGDAITSDRPMSYRSDFVNANLNNENSIWIIWAGQNGGNAISDVRSMIEHHRKVNNRFIVIPKITSTDSIDSDFFEEFGDRCIFIRKYLINYGLDDAGITPTAQDIIDIDNGIVPLSLRAVDESVHLNDTSYTILGKMVYRKLKDFGWI